MSSIHELKEGQRVSNLNTIKIFGTKGNLYKQPTICVLRKRCSENMQQIYGRTLMPKCDFNKVSLATLLKSHFGMGVLL